MEKQRKEAAERLDKVSHDLEERLSNERTKSKVELERVKTTLEHSKREIERDLTEKLDATEREYKHSITQKNEILETLSSTNRELEK